MKLSSFEQNSKLAEDGVWVDMGEGLGLLIARSGNPKYNKIVRSLSKPYKRLISAGTLPDEKYEEMSTIAMAKAILLDWKGLEDAEGVAIEYSEGAVLKILNDPDYRDFKQLVADLSEEQETFKNQEVEDTVGE